MLNSSNSKQSNQEKTQIDRKITKPSLTLIHLVQGIIRQLKRKHQNVENGAFGDLVLSFYHTDHTDHTLRLHYWVRHLKFAYFYLQRYTKTMPP